MSTAEVTQLAQELLARMGAGADPDDIAALFSSDVDFEIPGDVSRAARV